MSDQPPPFVHSVELGSLSERGAELRLAPDGAERARIAEWLGALEVPSFEATVRLERAADDLYLYDADFTAQVVQACVVTLEPVPSTHAARVSRRYRVVAPKTARRAQRDIAAAGGDDEDAPEVLSGTVLDIAAPVLEELSLALDPYPRAPGVTFELPKEESTPSDNPFAVLAKLKQSRPGEPEPRK